MKQMKQSKLLVMMPYIKNKMIKGKNKMSLNEIIEIVKDILKPRKRKEYTLELGTAQPVFEGASATQESKNSLYFLKALGERNRINFGFY